MSAPDPALSVEDGITHRFILSDGSPTLCRSARWWHCPRLRAPRGPLPDKSYRQGGHAAAISPSSPPPAPLLPAGPGRALGAPAPPSAAHPRPVPPPLAVPGRGEALTSEPSRAAPGGGGGGAGRTGAFLFPSPRSGPGRTGGGRRRRRFSPPRAPLPAPARPLSHTLSTPSCPPRTLAAPLLPPEPTCSFIHTGKLRKQQRGSATNKRWGLQIQTVIFSSLHHPQGNSEVPNSSCVGASCSSAGNAALPGCLHPHHPAPTSTNFPPSLPITETRSCLPSLNK